VLQRLRPCS